MRLMMISALLMLAAGCQPIEPAPSTSDSPAPATPSTAPTVAPTVADPHAPGVLFAIRTAKHSDHDSVEFEFGGTLPPPVTHQYEDEVRFDPSDQLVPLQGKAFLRVVFQGASLDNTAYENDPAKQVKYLGATRIAPGLPMVKELAVAGNFENVLSFGIGLDRKARVSVESSTDPGRITVNLWYS